MDEQRSTATETPKRPEEDADASVGLLCASRLKSLVMHYSLDSHFRKFYHLYTKPADLPLFHVMTLKPDSPGSPAGVVYRRLQVEVDTELVMIRLFDPMKKVLISCPLDFEYDPHRVNGLEELAEIRKNYALFQWPAQLDQFPERPFVFRLVGKAAPMLCWHDEEETTESLMVIMFLIYAVRRQLAREIRYQDHYSLTIENAVKR